ncbi:hypothetical protein DSM14862_00855 [Sulfitobacter indolifex]|uniref:Uncharacterized protein n=1 Tax=Sulfitobacter indolifex HEL-45 TaxID=391624 RepID=A0ABM9X6T2_9RHOB|nr:hypothetical protein [Sulfitobacter indolifex]EDQ05048.1 hypothetical protein OIHEL45_09913 [Sulfitobacter indolifex HEL-45]UOA18097.1 hypothetical protein DSM14862_00855 [Sulfitobacter indolifex]
MPQNKVLDAEYLIDLNGVEEALSTQSNFIRDTFVDALADGRLRIVKRTSKELKDCDDDLYSEYQQIGTKRYITPKVAEQSIQADLIVDHGGSLLGGFPPEDRFENIAICLSQGLKMVSAGKPLKDYRAIGKKCKLNGFTAMTLAEFAQEIG